MTDYSVIITTPETGRTIVACATSTDAENIVVDFVKNNSEQSYVVEVVVNS